MSAPLTFIELAEVDSTSSEAQRRLAAGVRPPFAVIAGRQSSGRGRRGNEWASPAGNLYMTLVLPPALIRSHGSLPLKTATLIARFIRAEVGLRVTLKWPNDLLAGGKKLGGLLLEAAVKGNEPAEASIGIGLNLNAAPDLAGDYAAVALADLVRGPFDPADFGRRLAAYLVAAWSDLSDAAVQAAYGEFAVADGELWRDAGRAVVKRSGGLSANGGLVLMPWPAAGGDVEELTSAEHGYAWALQGRAGDAQPLAIADVGNTRIKLAWYEAASATGPSDTWSCAVTEAAAKLPEMMRALIRCAKGRPYLLYVASVRPEASAALSLAAAEAGITVQAIRKRPVRVHGDAYPLTDLGIDRLCAMEGYVARRTQGDKLPPHGLVLAAGTATTIDVLSRDGLHLGGYILPGIELALAGLHQATGLLPAVDPRAAPQISDLALGRDTRSALYQGILTATTGAARLAGELAGGDVDVVVTGGNAALLAPLVRGRIVPDLVTEGARILVRG